MSDFLDETKAEIEARIAELEPVVQEHGRLRAALAALNGAAAAPSNGVAATPRGRPRGSGKRAEQALAAVAAAPGSTTSQVADALGIGPNYLYRLLPSLEEAGKVTKRGTGWHIA